MSPLKTPSRSRRGGPSGVRLRPEDEPERRFLAPGSARGGAGLAADQALDRAPRDEPALDEEPVPSSGGDLAARLGRALARGAGGEALTPTARRRIRS